MRLGVCGCGCERLGADGERVAVGRGGCGCTVVGSVTMRVECTCVDCVQLRSGWLLSPLGWSRADVAPRLMGQVSGLRLSSGHWETKGRWAGEENAAAVRDGRETIGRIQAAPTDQKTVSFTIKTCNYARCRCLIESNGTGLEFG